MRTDPTVLQSYDSVPDRISATLIGVTVTSIVFLSGISFALQKGAPRLTGFPFAKLTRALPTPGNVVETSLMLACAPPPHIAPPSLTPLLESCSYAVFQIFHLSSRPEMYSAGIWQQIIRSPGTNGHPPLPPLVLRSWVPVLALSSRKNDR